MPERKPRLVVFSSLFPSEVQPNAGLFIRERMFRVGKELPIVVVSPVPWFPFQGLIGRWKPNYRPQPAFKELADGIAIYHPRFFSVPGLFRTLDGFFMALGSWLTLFRLKRSFRFNLIDAHFAYPDGYAATLLGKWLDAPVTITLRGTEIAVSALPSRRKRLVAALSNATRVFAVADSLKRHAIGLGIDGNKILVVGNGVDTRKFFQRDRKLARQHLDIPQDAFVLISVGGLVERKGFHRVIEVLPDLLTEHPNLIYQIVGGASPEGDWRDRLEKMVEQKGLSEYVRFLGAMPHEQLSMPLSASDLFVLATSNEGWANVFLEAMACALPVIATDVGGNKEVVCHDGLGIIVPFGNSDSLKNALSDAITRDWDKQTIVSYAAENSWDRRIRVLTREFESLV